MCCLNVGSKVTQIKFTVIYDEDTSDFFQPHCPHGTQSNLGYFSIQIKSLLINVAVFQTEFQLLCPQDCWGLRQLWTTPLLWLSHPVTRPQEVVFGLNLLCLN